MPRDEKAVPFPDSDRQEAVRRILEVKRTGETSLNLGDLALEPLPPELGQLTRLRYLTLGTGRPNDIGEDQVESASDGSGRTRAAMDLSPLAKLTGLVSLRLKGGNLLSDLGPLRTLTGLTTLNLFFCELVSDLGPLRALTGLTKLYVNGCPSVSDLGPLCAINTLTTLEVTACELVSNLGPLRTLIGLTTLDLSHCESVCDLGPLRTLTELASLNLYECKSVSDLAPLMKLARLRRLVVQRTAVSLPDRLLGSTDPVAIMAWYRETKQATSELQQADPQLPLVDVPVSAEDEKILGLFEHVDVGEWLRRLQLFWCIGRLERNELLRAGPALGGAKLSKRLSEMKRDGRLADLDVSDSLIRKAIEELASLFNRRPFTPDAWSAEEGVPDFKMGRYRGNRLESNWTPRAGKAWRYVDRFLTLRGMCPKCFFPDETT